MKPEDYSHELEPCAGDGGFEPTAAQLRYLEHLEYDGPAPLTREEASWLIGEALERRRGGQERRP